MSQDEKERKALSPAEIAAGIWRPGMRLLPGGVIEVGTTGEKKMHDDEDTEERLVIEYPRKNKKKNNVEEEPVENQEPIPLLPNFELSAGQTIHALRVHKHTPPGDGIKGEVPPFTTLDFIAKRFGDGIYTFEGVNANGKVLRRNPNVKISMGFIGNEGSPGMVGSQVPSTTRLLGTDSGLAEKLLERQASEHEKYADRAKESADKAIDVAKQLSQDYSSMIREDSKVRIERDREYYAAQSKQQMLGFQALMMQMQQMHSQSMEQQRESFHQTIQIMQASHQHSQAMNNPALLFQLFERGLKFGQDSGESPDDPISSIVSAGVQGLSEMRQMMQLTSAPNPAKLPVAAQKTEKKKNPEKTPLSKPELLELIRLKKLAESKGYDFQGLVKQAQVMVENAPSSEPEESEEDESEETENETSEGTRNSDVE